MAVGISVVLVYALYRAIGMHYAQLEAGREIANRAQLARGLLRQCLLDLNCVFIGYKAEGGARSSDSTSDSGSASGTASTSATGGLVDEYSIPAGGVLGYADSILLALRVPPVDLDFSAQTGVTETANALGDVRIVRYRLADEEQNGVRLYGLVREMIYRLPDESSATDPMRWSRTDVLAEEVRFLQFRYHDGFDWLEEWASDESYAPAAIEIVLGVADPHVGPNGAETIHYYRVVAALTDTGILESASGSTAGAAAEGSTGGATGGNSGGTP